MDPVERRPEGKQGLKGELKKLKEMNKREIPGYIWEYYKFFFLGIIIVVVCIWTFASAWIENNKPVIYNGMAINAVSGLENGSDYFKTTFCDYLGVDMNDYNLSLQSNLTMDLDDPSMAEMNYSTSISLQANIAAKEVDFIIAPKDTIDDISSNMGAFFNLEEVLSEETYNAYKDKIATAVTDEGETIPCLIEITNTKFTEGMKFLTNEPLYVGFVINSTRADKIESFIDYVFNYTAPEGLLVE